MVVLGIALIVLGLLVVAGESHVSTGGVAAVAGGLIAAVGVGLALDGVNLVLALVAAVVVGAGVIVGAGGAARKVLAARRTAVTTGPMRLLNARGVVRTWSGREGQVAVQGALWRATLAPGWGDESTLEPGVPIVVEERDGLTVMVRPTQPWEADQS